MCHEALRINHSSHRLATTLLRISTPVFLGTSIGGQSAEACMMAVLADGNPLRHACSTPGRDPILNIHYKLFSTSQSFVPCHLWCDTSTLNAHDPPKYCEPRHLDVIRPSIFPSIALSHQYYFLQHLDPGAVHVPPGCPLGWL